MTHQISFDNLSGILNYLVTTFIIGLNRHLKSKRNSLGKLRSQSSLNKDLDMVEVSQEYVYKFSRPFQRHREYPPQRVLTLLRPNAKVSKANLSPLKHKLNQEVNVQDNLLNFLNNSESRKKKQIHNVKTMNLVKQKLKYANLRFLTKENEKVTNF